jgi:hypothetical protein
MSVISIPRKHLRQPQGRLAVDWDVLPAESTICVAVPGIEPKRSLAANPRVASVGAFSRVVTPHGIGGYLGGSGGAQFFSLGPSNALLHPTEYTLVVARVLDTSSSSFASAHYGFNVGPWYRCLVHYPYNGGLYFDYGNATEGSGRLSVTEGLSFVGGALDVMAFVAGAARGREIWRNGTLIGRNVAATASTTWGADTYSLGRLDETLPETVLLAVVCREALREDLLSDVTRNPWQLFRADPIRFYSLASSGIPTLSALAASNTTSTGCRASVSLAF